MRVPPEAACEVLETCIPCYSPYTAQRPAASCRPRGIRLPREHALATFTMRDRIEEAVNSRQVDLLVISGDLVDDVAQLDDAMCALEASRAPGKIIAVLGNHEELGDLPSILEIYKRHAKHITLLVNENTAISRNGATLRVAGVDFPLLPPSSHQ